LPTILGSSHVYRQIAISLFLNWIIGPFVRLALP
jgi:ACR3 family arsenite transporter